MIGFPQVALRLGAAALFGLLVGLERERRHRAAGMRTMALVALGAALFTLVSLYPYSDIVTAQRAQIEPTRIMAQIVTGIGFLGAGTIWLRKDLVRGLTTAAALWVVAAVGMACGAGQWILSGTAVGVLLVVLVALRPIEQWIFPNHGARAIRLLVRPAARVGEAIVRVQEICDRERIVIGALTISASARGDDIVKVECRAPQTASLERAIVEMGQVPGVRSVRADTRLPRAPVGA
jgi:putative Mg2+ transporter-C (MgtC) family protein